MKRQSIAIAGFALTSSIMLAACQGAGGPVAGADKPAATASASGTPGAVAPGTTIPGAAVTSSATGSDGAVSDAEGQRTPAGSAGGVDSVKTGPKKGGNRADSSNRGGSALTIKNLQCAPYPTMCNNAAGKLKDGKDPATRSRPHPPPASVCERTALCCNGFKNIGRAYNLGRV